MAQGREAAPSEELLFANGHLTPEQVCDLPMDELLAQVNGSLDTVDTEQYRREGINPDGFLGYTAVRRSGVTVITAERMHEATRDVAIRFLITKYLGLPADLFPDVFQATTLDRDGNPVPA